MSFNRGEHIMKILNVVGLAIISLSVVGCAGTPKMDPNYIAYIEAQRAMNEARFAQQKQPLFKMRAISGQTIELKGVDEFVIFAPENGGNGTPVAGVQQYVAPRNHTAEVIKAGLGLIGQVGSIIAVGKSVENLADSVGASSTRGYQYVQSPQPNMTIGGDGVIGTGSYSTSTLGGDGVIGTGTFSPLSGEGVIGAGSLTLSTELSGTGTMGAGNYSSAIDDNSNQGNPIDNSNQNNPITNPIVSP